MPPIRSFAFKHYNKLITIILLLNKVIPFCSYYVEKGFTCVAIMAPSGHQLLFCTKCTGANIRSLCDVRSVSDSKYIHCMTLLTLLAPYLICSKVLCSSCY